MSSPTLASGFSLAAAVALMAGCQATAQKSELATRTPASTVAKKTDHEEATANASHDLANVAHVESLVETIKTLPIDPTLTTPENVSDDAAIQVVTRSWHLPVCGVDRHSVVVRGDAAWVTTTSGLNNSQSMYGPVSRHHNEVCELIERLESTDSNESSVKRTEWTPTK